MTLQTRWCHYAISVDYWFLSKNNFKNPFHPDVVIIIFSHYDIIIFYYTLHPYAIFTLWCHRFKLRHLHHMASSVLIYQPKINENLPQKTGANGAYQTTIY